jgi:acetyltransferase-like isoleucine patch superfamily enzyme
VCVNAGTVIDARGGVTIGNDCLIGPNVVIVSSNHDISRSPMLTAPHILSPTTIESDVWIGANAVILAGVTVRAGSIIGAGAVVTRSTDPNGVYVGNPAKLTKHRTIREEGVGGTDSEKRAAS